MKRFLLPLLLLVSLSAFSQTKQPAILQVQNNGTTVGTMANYMKLNFTAGCTPTYSGGGFSINCAASSAFPITTAQTVNAGGSLVPSSTGQISSIGSWLPMYPGVTAPAMPTLTSSLTGGALIPTNVIFVKITFVGPATIVPSAEHELLLSNSSCVSGTSCSLIVTMPAECTSPTAPVTGCTVWDSTTQGSELQQAASANCVNITSATCVVGTLAAGSALSTPTTTGVTPASYVNTRTLPDHIVPSWTIQKGDNQNYPLAGLNLRATQNVITQSLGALASPVPYGKFTFLEGIGIYDWPGNYASFAGTPEAQSLLGILHSPGAVNTTGPTLNSITGAPNDYAVMAHVDDTQTAIPSFNEYLGVYLEQYIKNNNFICGGQTTWNGENCAAALRGTVADFRTAPVNAIGSNVAGVAGLFYINSSGSGAGYSGCGSVSTGPCGTGVQGAVAFQSAFPSSGTYFAGVTGQATGIAGVTNVGGAAFWATAPQTRFSGNGIFTNAGLFVASSFSNAADYSIFSLATSPSLFSGTLKLTGTGNPLIQVVSGATAPVSGSINETGSFQTSQASTPTAPNIANIGVAGAAQWKYCIVADDGLGNSTACSATGQTNTGNATLDTSNYNHITVALPVVATLSQIVGYDIYRTQSGGTPSSLGKIGTYSVATGCSNNLISGGCNASQTVLLVDDKGLAGDGTTAPTANSTGAVTFAGVERDAGMCRITADVSLTVNTANPFCSFNLPAVAQAYAFRCDILWAITAGSGTNNFAISVNSSSTPAATTNALASVTTTTSGTNTNGSAAISASGATTILTGATYTPAATVLPASITGTISLPGGDNVFAIRATANGTTATAAVKAGTMCRIF